MTGSASKLIRIKLVVLMAAIVIFAVNCWKTDDSANKVSLTLTGVDENTVESESIPGKDYGKFSHAVPEHEAIACDSCHAREGSKLKYAGHASCIDCHMGEFVKSDSNICAICHTNSNTNPAELQAFPARFQEGFNMTFDHALHSKGDAKPPQGCAACHGPQGASRTISAGISTHSQCFTCHTPESNIGSCNICHEIAPYARVTRAKSDVLNFAFSHADHNSVGCADCHSAKADAAQGRQITFPIAVEHFARKNSITCATCHNDRRAFGERDFANCMLCHKRSGFDLFPNK
jgi:hypothetical protein